jgi:predicted transcriptional regulator
VFHLYAQRFCFVLECKEIIHLRPKTVLDHLHWARGDQDNFK